MRRAETVRIAGGDHPARTVQGLREACAAIIDARQQMGMNVYSTCGIHKNLLSSSALNFENPHRAIPLEIILPHLHLPAQFLGEFFHH